LLTPLTKLNKFLLELVEKLLFLLSLVSGVNNNIININPIVLKRNLNIFKNRLNLLNINYKENLFFFENIQTKTNIINSKNLLLITSKKESIKSLLNLIYKISIFIIIIIMIIIITLYFVVYLVYKYPIILGEHNVVLNNLLYCLLSSTGSSVIAYNVIQTIIKLSYNNTLNTTNSYLNVSKSVFSVNENLYFNDKKCSDK
jgi:hypothetical protein